MELGLATLEFLSQRSTCQHGFPRGHAFLVKYPRHCLQSCLEHFRCKGLFPCTGLEMLQGWHMPWGFNAQLRSCPAVGVKEGKANLQWCPLWMNCFVVWVDQD